MSYRVRAGSFEGPFDLLLYLVSKQRVDIGSINITQIADQYLAEVQSLEAVDLDVASDFLVVASTLLEIKAASLLPKAKVEVEEELEAVAAALAAVAAPGAGAGAEVPEALGSAAGSASFGIAAAAPGAGAGVAAATVEAAPAAAGAISEAGADELKAGAPAAGAVRAAGSAGTPARKERRIRENSICNLWLVAVR